jgi:hypothetical protein
MADSLDAYTQIIRDVSFKLAAANIGCSAARSPHT